MSSNNKDDNVVVSKWRTSRWKLSIDRVECVKETERSVWIKEERFTLGDDDPDQYIINRHPRVSEYNQYHDSWDDAYRYILERAKGKVARLEEDLRTARGYLDTVMHTISKRNPQREET